MANMHVMYHTSRAYSPSRSESWLAGQEASDDLFGESEWPDDGRISGSESLQRWRTCSFATKRFGGCREAIPRSVCKSCVLLLCTATHFNPARVLSDGENERLRRSDLLESERVVGFVRRIHNLEALLGVLRAPSALRRRKAFRKAFRDFQVPAATVWAWLCNPRPLRTWKMLCMPGQLSFRWKRQPCRGSMTVGIAWSTRVVMLGLRLATWLCHPCKSNGCTGTFFQLCHGLPRGCSEYEINK